MNIYHMQSLCWWPGVKGLSFILFYMIFISLTTLQMNIAQVKACLCYIIKDFNANPLSVSSIVLLPINSFYIYVLEPPSTILHSTLLDYSYILSLILIISPYPAFTEGKKQLTHDIQKYKFIRK